MSHASTQHDGSKETACSMSCLASVRLGYSAALSGSVLLGFDLMPRQLLAAALAIQKTVRGHLARRLPHSSSAQRLHEAKPQPAGAPQGAGALLVPCP